jgi:hypothetical protein
LPPAEDADDDAAARRFDGTARSAWTRVGYSWRVSVIVELTNGATNVFDNPRATWRPEPGGALTILAEPGTPSRIPQKIVDPVPIVTFAPGTWMVVRVATADA